MQKAKEGVNKRSKRKSNGPSKAEIIKQQEEAKEQQHEKNKKALKEEPKEHVPAGPTICDQETTKNEIKTNSSD